MAAPDPALHVLLRSTQNAYTAENWEQCRQLAAELLSHAAAAADLPAEAQAHVWLAHAAQRQGEHNLAAAHAVSALTVSQGLNDAKLQARARVAAARVSWSVGDNNQALVDLEEAMRSLAQGGDSELMFDAHNQLGIVYGELGNDEASIAWHQRAMALAEHSGVPRMRAISRTNLAGRELEHGETLLNKQQTQAARAALERSLELNEQALQIAVAAGMQHMQVVIRSNQGSALALLGRRQEAIEAFELQLQLAAARNDQAGKVQRAQYLARMYREAGELTLARRLAAEGLEIGEAAGAKNQLVSLYELASAMAEQQQEFAEALRLYKRFHALRSEMALDSAQQRARVLSVRLETERALAEAATARQNAQALLQANQELTQRAEALGRDAMEDALTGLANRRRLDAYLTLRHDAARRAGSALCVALIDLDHFKRVNDAFSHSIGDQVLRQLSRLLQAHCRSQDLAARYGGEEFLIALDGVGLDDAVLICERLRQAIATHDWAMIAPGLAVTASLGVCDIAQHSQWSAGMKQADTLLYQAKQSGRNRVCA